MRFSGAEVVFYRLKFRSKTAKRHLGSIPEEQSDLVTFMVPSPEGDSEAGVEVAIFA